MQPSEREPHQPKTGRQRNDERRVNLELGCRVEEGLSFGVEVQQKPIACHRVSWVCAASTHSIRNCAPASH